MSANKPFLDRRALLRESFLSGGLLIAGFDTIRWTDFLETLDADHFRGGIQLGVVDFSDEGSAPMEQELGSELDGRLFTDLSKLTLTHPVTATDKFYIRTRASRLLDSNSPWTVQVGGLVQNPFSIPVQSLQRMARPMGLHLMECAGNSRSAHFGMLSVADWDGIPLLDILDQSELEQTGRVLDSWL